MATLFVGALSIAGAIVLVVDMDSPFEGLIVAWPEPMQKALATMTGLNLPAGGPLVFAVLAVAALFSLWLYPHLPEHYRSADTVSNVRLGMGVIASITAVLLGLLISGVKGHFDLVNRDVREFGAELIVLDRTLRFYGPDTAQARDLLARYTERVLKTTFPSSCILALQPQRAGVFWTCPVSNS